MLRIGFIIAIDYFNRSFSGGNLEDLHDFVNYLMDNKQSFDKIAGDHVVDEVMRDKLADVAKDISALLAVKKRWLIICIIVCLIFSITKNRI